MRQRLLDYLSLTKPLIAALLLLTTLSAMFVAAGGAPRGEAGRGNPLVGQRDLRPAERDAGGVHVVVLRGVQHQPAPAAADVEQPLAGLEA